MDCGHFIKRQHLSTRFSETNCATQCKRCNAFEQGRDTDFANYIIDRWGESALVKLATQRHLTLKLGKFELEQIAKYYKEKSTELAKSKNIELW